MIELFTPEESGERLRVSARWLKDQARLRKIPFTFLGGQYRFSEEHLRAIVTIFEQLPEASRASARASPRRKAVVADEVVVTQLKAHRPRRRQSA